MKIKCLVCGKQFNYLPSHIRMLHGMTANEYREAFDIPQGEALASESYREMQASKIRRMQAEGRLTYDHLSAAVDKSRNNKRRPKRGEAREKQKLLIAATRPWEYKKTNPK